MQKMTFELVETDMIFFFCCSCPPSSSSFPVWGIGGIGRHLSFHLAVKVMPGEGEKGDGVLCGGGGGGGGGEGGGGGGGRGQGRGGSSSKKKKRKLRKKSALP